MRVSLELPEPKASKLDAALAKQFADIQRQLLGLVNSQQREQAEMRSELVDALESQQQSLVRALERLLSTVGKAKAQPADGLVEALRGLKQVMADLPSELHEALDQQYQAVQSRTMKVAVRPSVTVSMPKGLNDRLDSLQTAVLNGLRHSRNRTFGSNY